MTEQEIKITQDRIAVIIGKGGRTKRLIEKKTNTALDIDSVEGIVKIESEDAFAVIKTAEIIRAINRGFSPERAFVLPPFPIITAILSWVILISCCVIYASLSVRNSLYRGLNRDFLISGNPRGFCIFADLSISEISEILSVK